MADREAGVIPIAQSNLLQGAMLAALAVVIAWVMLRTHRQFSRQKEQTGPLVEVNRPEQGQRGHHLSAPPDVLRWEVQMHETARELSAQLDSKISVLRALIAEADRAATRLEAAAGRSAPAPSEPLEADSPPANQAQGLGSSSESGKADRMPPRSPAKRDCEEIYTLADYGMAAEEIARRVGIPVGEVELILGLRERT